MATFKDADPGEIRKFDALARILWDPNGEMGTLHAINPLRTGFIMEQLAGRNPKILDVGCGGGILSEALAKAGAQVTGIDASEASIEVARKHARARKLKIEYRHESVGEISGGGAGGFDAVTCMEILEHVPEPERMVAACARVLKPGGDAFFSTITRTPKGFLFAILGGEYILHLLPRGSHAYRKLIRPRELKGWAEGSGLELSRIASLLYNPFTRKFRIAAGRADVNYMMHFVKRS